MDRLGSYTTVCVLYMAGAVIVSITGMVLAMPAWVVMVAAFLTGVCISGGQKSVIALARSKGYEVIERAIMPEEMKTFEQCFLTGTAAEVTPVSEIGPYTFRPGEITKTLMEEFHVMSQPKQPALAANA